MLPSRLTIGIAFRFAFRNIPCLAAGGDKKAINQTLSQYFPVRMLINGCP